MNKLVKYIESNFSDELKLIVFLSQDGSEKKYMPSSELDWVLFIDLIKKHRLVSHVLKNTKAKIILPNNIYKDLKSIQLDQIKKSLLLNGELLRIHDALNKINIDHIFFKGSLLSFELYNDIGFRNFRDIDLIVSKNDVEQANSAILDLEYGNFEPDLKLSEKQKQINYSISHHYHLQHSELPVDIELHWNLTNPKSFLSISTEVLLRNKQFIDFQSYTLPYISISENIVFLAAHGAIHQWYRLFWLKDFSEILLKSNQEKISKALKLSKKLNLGHCFRQACTLSHLVYKTDLPNFGSLKKINNRLIQIPLKSIATTELKQRGIYGKVRFVFYRLGLKPNLRYYIDLIFRLRTHYTDWEIIKLPNNLFFLYYLLRPFLLIYKSITK